MGQALHKHMYPEYQGCAYQQSTLHCVQHLVAAANPLTTVPVK